MPSGAGVIEYRGKRGVVWRIKYADATGRQVMETLGPERDGWTRKKAEAELRERLVRGERGGWRGGLVRGGRGGGPKPAPLTFEQYAGTWFAEGEVRRKWRPRTVIQYK